METYFYERDPGESLHWSWAVKRRNRVGGANTIARCMFSHEAALIASTLNKMESYQEAVEELQSAKRGVTKC